MRIGHGYDVHKLVEGRPLILGGVRVPYEKGLLGHSDADVLIHAVMDGLLGALSLGDIGLHFPDNDPRWNDADSRELLRHVWALIKARGYRLVNLDATIICQSPKLMPFIESMRQNIAADLEADLSGISLKATTEEGLGISGSGGIAAHCVLLLEGQSQ